jgi:hypothetical protein
MPVRAIKKIESHKTADQGSLSVKVPEVILDAFKIDSGDEFICEIKRHFDKSKKAINEANETETFKTQNVVFPPAKIIGLSETPLAKKYGFVVGDYIEIVFLTLREIKKSGFFSRKEDEVTTTDIFPERTIDELDFNPDR